MVSMTLDPARDFSRSEQSSVLVRVYTSPTLSIRQRGLPPFDLFYAILIV